MKRSQNRAAAVTGHPLVGVWVEEGNPIDTTTVVYTITEVGESLSVSGVDQSDGIALSISNTVWDGEGLHFVSLFPPSQHQASHEFVLVDTGRARHRVSYSDEDGNHTVNEVWKKIS
jgi:hypothetical protein